MTRITGVKETCLYVEDLERTKRFYQDLLGLEVMTADAHFCAFAVAGAQVLLLFKRGTVSQPTRFDEGTIPGHDGAGPAHIGFSIPAEDLEAWRQKLGAKGIPIEGSMSWSRGGVSLYFRDPDQHLVELLTPGVWPIY